MPIWLSQAAKLDLADIAAVDPDGAGIDIPESREEVHQRCLAAAVGADQRDALALANRQGEVTQARASLPHSRM